MTQLLCLFILLLVVLRHDSDARLVGLPEDTMSTCELIEYNGYPCEAHTTTTEDGYILTLHRIPHGRNESGSTKAKPVILLQHGLFESSADWVENPPEQSAAFIFADAGYDVFLGNVRGNIYARVHVNRSSTSAEFWDFSWDEMAEFDLPALFDCIYSITAQRNITYVGHSQGTLMMFAHLARHPSFSDRVSRFFALAPVGGTGHIRGLVKWIAKSALNQDWIENFLYKWFGRTEFVPTEAALQTFVAPWVCGAHALTNPLCKSVLFLFSGVSSNQLNETRLSVYMSHANCGTSTKNILHWGQIARTDRTTRFDYMDEKLNRIHYNQPTPPEYDFSRVAVPTYLYYSDADWLADAVDVQQHLIEKIPKQYLKSAKKLTDFNHVDFLWGLRARKDVYDDMLSILGNGNSTNA